VNTTLKILVVEDEIVSSQVLCSMLEQVGEVHSAINGKEALEKFTDALDSSDPFKLVLLDIMMPEMDGQEALMRIRALEEERNLSIIDTCRVIITTALNDQENLYQAYASGCTDYLVKPIKKDTLLKLLFRMGLIDHLHL
jgi:two-component system chemotaxis response regulator CheY